ncbi:MAG: HAMP domain-containing histidine kinase [Muribaculaceae bacterium]|nr:HAMP domain-containing histidine kinase [Muribaculaceae bacterium]
MTQKLIWIILATASVIGCGVVTYFGLYGYTYPLCALTLVSLVMLYRTTEMPMHAIRTGMGLLKSRDYASRLRLTGQKETDEVVTLYNTIISNIKAERLKKLEQDNFLSKLVEVSPMGIAICSLDGQIERTNPAFDSLSGPILLETLYSLPDCGQTTIRPDATQVLKCSKLSFMDRGFRRPFYLVERLTDEIVRAETTIFNKVVRTMGHEVNNTLGGVVSVLETLSTIHAGDEEMVAAIDSCRSSCINLGAFVKGYSDVVKLPEPELEIVNLNQFVSESLPFLAEMFPANITLDTDLYEPAPSAYIDPMLIHRVLVNAVKNSVESIGRSAGRIVIRTAPNTLEVIDNGKGISDEVAKHIFSPFFSTKNADRGLGLMLISDILRRHNATFTLTTAPDRLTRLTITFKH